MASRTKPLISAAALASAAAIAVATPAIAPNLGVPTPAALSKAAFQLTTIADVLSVPPVVWTDLLFNNDSWGGTLGPDTYGPDWAAPQDAFLQPSYVNPWVSFCDNGCTRSGIAGVSYLFLDALINGNGNGFEDNENWPIGFVNYFAEPTFLGIGGAGNSPNVGLENAGYSAAAWYVLQGTIGQAVPELTIPLAALFWADNNVPVFYNFSLAAVAGLLNFVPVVGPFAGNSLLAYLGDLALDPENPSLGYYQYGLSGTLNYWIDIATGAVPFPGAQAVPAPEEAAALVAAPAVAEVDTAKVASAEVADSAPVVDAPSTSPVVEAPAVGEPAVEVADAAPVAEVTGEAPVVEVADEAPAVEIEDVATEVEAEPADAPEAPAVDVPDEDIDVADLDVADLDVAGDDAADAPADDSKGSASDEADSASTPAAESSKADTDSAGDGAGASDSAGSDKGDSES